MRFTISDLRFAIYARFAICALLALLGVTNTWAQPMGRTVLVNTTNYQVSYPTGNVFWASNAIAMSNALTAIGFTGGSGGTNGTTYTNTTATVGVISGSGIGSNTLHLLATNSYLNAANLTGTVQTLTVVTGAFTAITGNGAGITNLGTNSLSASAYEELVGGGSGDISTTSSNNMVSAWTSADTTVSNVSRVITQMPEFTVWYKGDLHAGTNSYGPDTGNGWPVLTNEFTRMLAEATSINAKAFISAGDCWDDSLWTTPSRISDLTNQLWRFPAAGIPFISCIGNHEDNQSTTNYNIWSSYMGPLLTASGLTAQSTNNDYTECIFVQTNSQLKMAFITVRYLNDSSADWLTYCSTNWPNHQLFVLCHLGLGGGENLPSVTQYFPFAYERISKLPNVFAVNSGHFRDIWSWSHSIRQTETGTKTWIFMNTQSQTNAGAHLTRYYRFKPQVNVVSARTYDAQISSYLTNGQMTAYPVISSNGIASEFSFPIQSAGASPNYYRLIGRDKAYAGTFNTNADAHLGSWSRPGSSPFASNELFDTAITFDRRSVYGGFSALDSFVVGRFYNSTNLTFAYAPETMRDHFHSGTRVLSVSTGGVVNATAFVGDGNGLTFRTITNSVLLLKAGFGSATYLTNTTANGAPDGYWFPVGASSTSNYVDFVMSVPAAAATTIPRLDMVVTEAGTLVSNVIFVVSHKLFEDAEAMSTYTPTYTERFTNTVGTAGTGFRSSRVSNPVATLTNSFTTANAGRLIRIRVARDGTDVADTMATNIVLLVNPSVVWGAEK